MSVRISGGDHFHNGCCLVCQYFLYAAKWETSGRDELEWDRSRMCDSCIRVGFQYFTRVEKSKWFQELNPADKVLPEKTDVIH